MTKALPTYGIRKDYESNLNNDYYSDEPETGVTWQPDVYDRAIKYAKSNNIQNIIDIGSGNGEKLVKFKNDFNITFIDFGPNLDTIKSKFNKSSKEHFYIDQDFEEAFPELEQAVIEDSVIICSDVVEHIRKLDNLADALVEYSQKCRLMFISTPERQLLYGYDRLKNPANKCHVREWKLEELTNYFQEKGMDCVTGMTRSNDQLHQRATIVIVSGIDLAPFQVKDGDDFVHRIYHEVGEKSGVPDSFTRWNEDYIGFYNGIGVNFFSKHLNKALAEKKPIKINLFRFINEDSVEKYYKASVENVDRLAVQYVGTDTYNSKSKLQEYPTAISVILRPDRSRETSYSEELPLIMVGDLRRSYVLELIFGFDSNSFLDAPKLFSVNSARFALEASLEEMDSLRAGKKADSDRINDLEKEVLALKEEMRALHRNPAKYVLNVAKRIKNRTLN